MSTSKDGSRIRELMSERCIATSYFGVAFRTEPVQPRPGI